MNRSEQKRADAEARFERAFVAMNYLLGRRGADLCSALPRHGESAEELVHALGAETRDERARVLARELQVVVAALDARRIQ